MPVLVVSECTEYIFVPLLLCAGSVEGTKFSRDKAHSRLMLRLYVKWITLYEA